MNTRNLLFTLLLSVVVPAQAVQVDTSCAPQAVAALESQASYGNSRAQYWLGTQLELGACGTKDSRRANSLLQQSAAKNFPPAVHILGLMLRRDGKDAEALKYFERSAELGFQHGFADMGFTYGLRESPVRNEMLSYAWFTVAISREPKAQLREYLENSRAEVVRTMSEDDLVRAKGIAAELGSRFTATPIWSDTQ